MPIPHHLTPADIMDLRLWRRSAGGAMSPDGMSAGLGYPFLVCAPSDGTLYLHSQGRTVAGGLAPAVMCALLYMERLEPGWCAEASNPTLTIEEALRTPGDRAEARRAASARMSMEREAVAAQHAAKRRESTLLRPPTREELLGLDLDDLLG